MLIHYQYKGDLVSQDKREACLQDWTDREAIAESMIPLIGTLYRNKNVVTSVYGRDIINRSVIQSFKVHRFVRHMEDQELSIHDTFPIINALKDMDISRVQIDVGKLAVKYRKESNGRDLQEFLNEELEAAIGAQTADAENRDVVLYGFGRIGRLLARILIEKSGGGKGLRLRAIV